MPDFTPTGMDSEMEAGMADIHQRIVGDMCEAGGPLVLSFPDAGSRHASN